MTADTPWLDPELAAALAGLAWSERTQAVVDPEELASARARLVAVAEPPDGRPVRSEEIRVPRPDGTALLLRVHRPSSSGRLAVLVWLHGGGYLLGSAASDPRVERAYADRVGCCVVGVDYRVAPEHPHPAALEDVLAALAWVRSTSTPDLDPARVAVGGESAGAGLAAAAALADRDLRLQLLVAPMLDDRTDDSTAPGIARLGLWAGELNQRAWTLYLGDGAGRATAAAARAADLVGLAPAYLDVGTADLFCAETVAHAERLRRSGVPTELHVWPGAFHGFYELAPAARLSVQARGMRDAALRRALR